MWAIGQCSDLINRIQVGVEWQVSDFSWYVTGLWFGPPIHTIIKMLR